MPETVNNIAACRKCGAEIRPDTQYCYNCGGFLGTSEPEPVAAAGNGASNGVSNAEAPAVTADVRSRHLPSRTAPGKLRSAAEVRRQSRNFERKPVEVVWEPVEDETNPWFVIATIALALFALLAVALSLYFK